MSDPDETQDTWNSTELLPTERQWERETRRTDNLVQLLRDVRPYVELEASLQNSGHGNVIGNPAKALLRRIDEALT